MKGLSWGRGGHRGEFKWICPSANVQNTLLKWWIEKVVIIQVTVLGNGHCCDVINSPWPLLLFPNLCVLYHMFLGWVWRTNSFNKHVNTYWVTETIQGSGHNKKKVISVLLRWEESHRQDHPNKSLCCLILIVSLTEPTVTWEEGNANENQLKSNILWLSLWQKVLDDKWCGQHHP